MRVLIGGATGTIGRPLVRQLLAAGHEVVGLTRSAERARDLEQRGARAVVCDVLDREALLRAVSGAKPEAVVHQLTAIPRRIDPRKLGAALAPTNRLRIEGTRNLVEAARESGARRFLAQSVAFAYAPAGGRACREEDPLIDDAPPSYRPVIDAVRSLEAATLGSTGLEGAVLRYGYFYGPGTVYARDGSFAEDVGKRRVPLVGDGGGVFSFIHIEDAASATVAALAAGATGVYNVVDDEPAPVREWLPLYAKELGAPAPLHVPRIAARVLGGAYVVHLMCEQAGASNAKARASLGWAPRYTSWREGMREMLAA